ncbi:MAG TPA: hypothetical protein VFT56_01195 [Sphingomonas sp.]|nr:hypothetical protein [Sphingomonas sp.]
MNQSDEAVGRLARDEAEALVKLLESGGRKVLVVIAYVEGGFATLTRAVSEGTTALDARGFVQVLDRERDRIDALLMRRADG